MASTNEINGEPQQTSSDVFYSTLRYKTYVLKVPLHCKDCAKKVTNILRTIDGVYMTEVDFDNHRVTVHGDVETETMIKKLRKKTKKRVEVLWPEAKTVHKDVTPIETKSIEKQSVAAVETSEEAKGSQGGGGDKRKGKQPVKAEVVEVKESGSCRVRNFEAGSCSYSMKMEEVLVGKPHQGGGGVKIKELQTGNLPSQSPPVAAEKQSEVVGGVVNGNGSGGDGGGDKKKKGKEKKGGDENVNVAERDAPSNVSLPPAQPWPQSQGHANVQTIMAPNISLPPAQLRPQSQVQANVPNPMLHRPMPPPYYRAPHQQHVYEQSYYTYQQQLYEQPYHWGLGNEVSHTVDNLLPSMPVQPPQPFPQSHPSSSVSGDTFAFFSDEDINGCSVM